MRRVLPAMALMFVLVAAACTGGADTAGTEGGSFDEASGQLATTGATSEATSAASAVEAPAEFERAAGGEDAAEGTTDDALGSGGVTPVSAQTPLDLGRQIIFTARLEVSVPDVARAGEEATQIIESLGGFLFGQDTVGAPDPRSVLVFRIAPEHFQEALRRLGGIGELRSQNVTADDVTERVVDLESRIATAEASVERLRAFLQNATEIKDIAELESQLLLRETELESLRGQLRTIQNQVSLATITLVLTETGVAPAVRLFDTVYPGADDSGASCPGDEMLTVEEGSEVTLCFEIRNEGDAPLTDFTLTDSVLEIELDDLLIVFGDPNEVLQPGQNIILAYETTVDRRLRTQTRVQAIPLDQDGQPIPSRQVSNTQSLTVATTDPGGLPGFQDGLEASWRFLQTVWALLVLIAGALLPFVWIIPTGWWLWRRRSQAGRRRHSGTSAAIPAATATEVSPRAGSQASTPGRSATGDDGAAVEAAGDDGAAVEAAGDDGSGQES